MNHLNYKNQQGIALPVALIFLLVSSLIGISTLKTNTLNEKMTNNSIQRDKAFSKAEEALLEGELFVRTNAAAIKNVVLMNTSSDSCTATLNSQNGICSTAKHPTNPLANKTIDRWQINNIFTNTTTSRAAVNGARYIVEFMGHSVDSTNATACTSYETTWPYCEDDALLFRITTLATGDDPQARVMLQSTYIVAPVAP